MSDQPVAPQDIQHVTQDFIFGDLSSSDALVRQMTRAGLGLGHRSRTFPPVPVAGEPVTVECSAGMDLSVRELHVLYTTDGSLPDRSALSVPMMRHAVDWLDLNWGYGERWRAEIPAQAEDVLVSYRIRATTHDGDLVWADPDPGTGEPGRFAYWLGDASAPDWLCQAVIYHIFIDRFATTGGAAFQDVPTLADFFGGSIEGIRERLGYLSEQGVTCLWLSPLFPSPTHHGYDATDYVSVEHRLGTMEQVVALIEDAHTLGIRVLLDFVANHCSDQHPLFRQALLDSNAPERAMFAFSGDTYQSFFDVGTMPEFALDREPALTYIINAARFWTELGVDGYRLDYATGPSHAFWAAFRAAVRSVNPEVALIGEITGSATQLGTCAGRLDGALDFLLLQSLRAFIAFDLIDAGAFGRFVERHGAFFASGFVLPSFLDNHDMNRFLWMVRGDVRRLKLAALLQFMLPGPPVIYYGTEAGVNQARDLEYPDGSRKLEESRTPMAWGADQDTELLAFYRRLIRQRTQLLQRFWSAPISVPTGDPSVLVLSVGDGIWIAINRSEDPKSIETPASVLNMALLTNDRIEFRGQTVTLPAMAGCLLLAG